MFPIKFQKIFLMFIFVFFSSISFAVQIQPPDGDTQLPPVCQELIAKAQEKGEIEILVVLDVPFTPEGNLNKERLKEQRTLISNKKADLRTKLASFSGEATILKEFSDIIPVVFIKADSQAIAELCTEPLVKSIEENKELEPSLTDSIPLINADDAADSGYTGAGWTVAILDTGVDKDHKFLNGKVVYEACYSTDDPGNNKETLCPNGMETQIGNGAAAPCSGVPQCDHGTHVAGIAAGKDNTFGSNGIYGVARDANIIAIQVFTKKTADCGTGKTPPCLRAYDDDLISALTKVYDLRNTYNIASVNMSLGGGKYGSYCDGKAIKTIIDNLVSAGIAVVISAGNDGYCDGIGYPACVSSAIPVGSTKKDDTKSSFSNYDPDFENFIFAPGSLIKSSIPSTFNDTYSNKSGTSMAAPHVTGAFAVMRQFVGTTPTVDDIINSFQTTGAPITACGNSEPRIDLFASLQDFNSPPLITNFTAFPISGYAPLLVDFTCSGTDSDGSIVSYKWDFDGDNVIDKTTNTGSTSYTYTNKGTYNATCTVVDNLGATDKSSSIAINVKLHYKLSVLKGGLGSGTVTSNPSGIDCGGDCSNFYDENTDVTLTATLDPDNAFVEWNGDCDPCGSNPVCTVTMNSDKTCEAVFEPLYTLTITKSGTGDGTVTSNPAGINCGGACSADFINGTPVTLTASVSGNNAFFGWTGDCASCGNNLSCTIDMTSDKNCDAEFNKTTENGKMYGRFAVKDGSIAQVRMKLPCVKDVKLYPRRWHLYIQGNGNNFKAKKIESVVCYDDPDFNPPGPSLEFDTMNATFKGLMNGKRSVIIEIEVSDGGVPNVGNDYAFITIKDAKDNSIILQTEGMIHRGYIRAYLFKRR